MSCIKIQYFPAYFYYSSNTYLIENVYYKISTSSVYLLFYEIEMNQTIYLKIIKLDIKNRRYFVSFRIRLANQSESSDSRKLHLNPLSATVLRFSSNSISDISNEKCNISNKRSR